MTNGLRKHGPDKTNTSTKNQDEPKQEKHKRADPKPEGHPKSHASDSSVVSRQLSC